MTILKQILDLNQEEDLEEALRRTRCVIQNLELSDNHEVQNGYLICEVNNFLIAFKITFIDEDTLYYEQMLAENVEVNQ